MARTASETPKIAVLTSGNSRGSNLRAICEFTKRNQIGPEIAFVVITKKQAPVTEVCCEYKLPCRFISSLDINGFERELLREIERQHISLLVLCGFMKQLSPAFLNRLEIPVLNIHPALLPKYGGKGMFGMNVHRAVYEAGEKISGASIHLVNEDYDRGRIIAQQSTDISDCSSPEEIAARVLKVEHELYPKTIIDFLNKL